MAYEDSLQYITFQEELEFGCLIPSLLEKIKKHPQEIKKIKLTKTYNKRSSEERRSKNTNCVKNNRRQKKIFEKLLEEKAVQFRKKYKSLTGHKYIMDDVKPYVDFTVYPNMSKKDRANMSVRKSRYNKKIYIENLEEEVKKLQKEIIKLTS
jgi:hypothetical protein